jgi:hypothetical protein
MQAQFLSDFQRLVSIPRYDAFRNGGNDVEALARYLWNTALCESLYPAFQILEVGFRNAVHSEIGIECGEPEWLLNPPAFLQLRELDTISQAITGLRKEQKPVDEPRMVAKLNFGFWTCLLDKPYDQLWHKIIRQVVPLMPRRIRTRQNLSSHLHSIRKLRNLAFHHHAIWHHPHLKRVHQNSLEVIQWLSISLGSVNAVLDRFPTVLDEGSNAFIDAATTLIQKSTT